MNISKQAVILSPERFENNSKINGLLVSKLKRYLDDSNFAYDIGSGVYKNGPAEASFVVIVENVQDIETLKVLAFKEFHQESILVQDSNQEAYLSYHDGKEENLGILQAITKEHALEGGDYTLLNNTYYGITRRLK